MDLQTALRRVPFLKKLPEPALAALTVAGFKRTLEKGELLFSALDRSIGLIVVLEGAVRVYQVDARGRELTLSLEMPGESVVELPLFDGGNYPVNAEAGDQDTIIYIVPRQRFWEMMTEHPEIAAEGARAMAIRVRRLLSMLEAQTLHTVQSRLASYLVGVAASRQEFSLQETNGDIASSIGTVREVVSRTLRSLQEQGAIRLSGRHVTVCDEGLLRRLSGQES